MVDFGADESFGKACAKLKEHYGLEVGASRVREECLLKARELPQQAQGARTLAAKGSEAIIAEADGTMIPVVDIAQEQADRRKHRKTRWQEMRLVAAQAQGSVKTHYAAGFDTPEQTGSRWTQVVRQAGWSAQSHIHGVGDGADWIASQFEQHFGSRGNYTLDMYHVCEYLSACAPPGQADYVGKAREALKQNKTSELISELASRLEPESAADENAPVRRAHRYLEKRRGQLDYQGALARGLPIGSGLIESGHRHVLQARLKIPGAWWKPDNAHAMAQLRTCRANGLWHTLWMN